MVSSTKWPEVEKSIKKQISPLRFAPLEMTGVSAFIMYNWYDIILTPSLGIAQRRSAT
jgi:hypothetical protein